VRSNLDPFSTYDDATLWDALRRSSLVDDYHHHPSPGSSSADINDSGSHNTRITLDTVIETDGANLSVGQRSLLSLARALVKDARIVVLDEATYATFQPFPDYSLPAWLSASVDYETDTKIQSTVLSQFHGRTLICIARRLCCTMLFHVL
jgi:ATP-binding cassette, subfamily C (CFTR/MRP), member 1